MLDYATMEAALASWIVAATGFAPGRVVPKHKKTPGIAMPYVTYDLPVANQAQGPDEVRTKYDAGADKESYVTRGQREFIVAIQCYTKATVGGVDAEGNYTARAYLSKILSKMALPSIRAALSAAGLVFVQLESVADFTEKLGPVGQGRGTLDVRFRCVDSDGELVDATTPGYIQTVTKPAGTYT